MSDPPAPKRLCTPGNAFNQSIAHVFDYLNSLPTARNGLLPWLFADPKRGARVHSFFPKSGLLEKIQVRLFTDLANPAFAGRVQEIQERCEGMLTTLPNIAHSWDTDHSSREVFHGFKPRAGFWEALTAIRKLKPNCPPIALARTILSMDADRDEIEHDWDEDFVEKVEITKAEFETFKERWPKMIEPEYYDVDGYKPFDSTSLKFEHYPTPDQSPYIAVESESVLDRVSAIRLELWFRPDDRLTPELLDTIDRILHDTAATTPTTDQ